MIKLKVKRLKKYFGPVRVFSDISFEHDGGSLAIAGSNGSGKSTLLKCLAVLLRPGGGDIQWENNGNALTNKELKSKLGYAAPYINLYDELSCRENLAFLSKVRHEASDSDRIDHWIQRVELQHVADQPFGKLSTGQQQRLRLASALFHDPDILFLDEPGSNLDEAGRLLVREIATSFHSDEKLLVIASNNPEEIELCDRVFSIELETFA